MKTYIILLGALACAGCSHNVSQPAVPTPAVAIEQPQYPALPPTPSAPAMVEVQYDHIPDPPTSQTVQCGEMTVHVGKLDVNMPNGGSLEIAGIKGETKAYHILLQDVSFTHKETCLR